MYHLLHTLVNTTLSLTVTLHLLTSAHRTHRI